MRHLIAVAVVCAASAAHADPAETPRLAVKSPRRALAWSAGGTAAGLATMALGGVIFRAAPTAGETTFFAGAALTLAGPSFGHIYADDTWSTGLELRLGGAAIAGTGLVLLATDSELNSERCNQIAHQGVQDGSCTYNAALVKAGVALLGFVTIGAGSALDIATAPRAARRANITIAPTLVGKVAGLGVVGRF